MTTVSENKVTQMKHREFSLFFLFITVFFSFKRFSLKTTSIHWVLNSTTDRKIVMASTVGSSAFN